MTDEPSALLVKAHRYLNSAALLRAAGDYDSAASRLYYAMFYCAELLLLTKDVTRSSHQGVIAAFGHHLVKTGELPQEMHRCLLDGFSRRQLADYQPTLTMTEADVDDLALAPTQFIVNTEEHLNRLDQA